MKVFKSMLFMLLVSFLAASSAWADENPPSAPVNDEALRVADNSSSGTYQQILQQMMSVCPDTSLTEVPVQGGGAVDNLNKLTENEANLAFMHYDVILSRSRMDDLSNLKTLLALFPEEIHILALNKDFKVVPQNVFDFNKKNIRLDSITDLAGLPVGAAGGGYISGKVIQLQGEIPYNLVQFNTGGEVLNALNDGKIAAAIFVGAAPLKNIKDLGNNYKLLFFADTTIDRLKLVYRKSTVTYVKMNPNPVTTIATDSLLVTRDYKTPEKVEQLLKFRTCVQNNVQRLREKTGFHKSWQKVDINNHGKCWLEGSCWYEGDASNTDSSFGNAFRRK